MLFSLLCTVYNRQSYLAEAINSAIAQSFQDWELIIWDDGSTDNSRAIALEFAAKDSRILVRQSAQNNGRAMALQNAIRASRGEWLGLLDSDDALRPNTLQEVADAIELAKGRAGIIYTDRCLINVMGEPIRFQRSPSPEDCLHHDLSGFVPFHFQCWNRAIFEQIEGIDLRLAAAIDLDISLKMLEKAPVWHIPKPLYFHRVHPDRMSTNAEWQTMQALHAVRKAIDRRGLNLQATLKWEINPIRSGHPAQIN